MGNLRDYKFLAHLNLVEQDFYWLFDVIRHLHCVLFIYQIYGNYLAVPNIEPVHLFNKQLVGISHNHILSLFDLLVVNGCNGNVIEGDVHVFD